MVSYPNPDIEKETVFPPCHCLPAVGRRAPERCVPARRSGRFRHAGVAIRRSRCEGAARGNLKSCLASLGTGLRFARNDDPLNRDLGVMR
jgi:hypothetical protein